MFDVENGDVGVDGDDDDDNIDAVTSAGPNLVPQKLCPGLPVLSSRLDRAPM